MNKEQAQFECSECHADVREEDKVCPKCGSSLEELIIANEKTPTGIGGWLILVAIGLLINLLILIFNIPQTFLMWFQGDTWAILTTPGTKMYHPMWMPLLIVELAGTIIFIIFSVIITIFFFQKKAIFPTMMIIFLVSKFLFTLIDNSLASTISSIPKQGSFYDPQSILRTLLVCAIWIPYFLVSKRVKATFIL